MTLRFLNPDMAAWLVVVPVTFVCWLASYLYKVLNRRRTAVQPRFVKLSRRSTLRRDVAILVLGCAAMAMLVGALTRPQVLLERRVAEFERQDLILILDRSVSMRARDIRPSRSDRALTEIKNFLRRKPPEIDRVALVGFSATSLVLSYLTSDVDNILFYLDWIADDPAVLYGTDIGKALASAMEVVKRDDQPTRKLFLVISDGEDQGTTFDESVTAVRTAHIRVHSIGIGSHQEALIPAGVAGDREAFLKGDDGRLLRTRFNESSLRSLAAATGGRYLRSVTGSELHAALDTIANADRVQTGWRTTTEYRDIYGTLLMAALVAAVTLVALL